jgi:hypothetical protein
MSRAMDDAGSYSGSQLLREEDDLKSCFTALLRAEAPRSKVALA